MRWTRSTSALSLLLALPVWVAIDVQAQVKQPAKPAPQTKPAATLPQVAKRPPKPGQVAKPLVKPAPPTKAAQPGKQAAKQPAKTTPKPRTAKIPKTQKPGDAAAILVKATVARRDPFDPLVSRQRPGGDLPDRLPPGKAGLVISTLRVDGIVRGPNGMIAVVSNPQQRVYFLREGDQLYDGRVLRITMEGVSFHETGKDAFGKPVDRQMTKRLYPSPGEQR